MRLFFFGVWCLPRLTSRTRSPLSKATANSSLFPSVLVLLLCLNPGMGWALLLCKGESQEISPRWVSPKIRMSSEVHILQYPTVHLKDLTKFRWETYIILELVGVSTPPPKAYFNKRFLSLESYIGQKSWTEGLIPTLLFSSLTQLDPASGLTWFGDLIASAGKWGSE